MAKGLRGMVRATPVVIIIALVIACIAGVFGSIYVLEISPETALAEIVAEHCQPGDTIETYSQWTGGDTSNTIYLCYNRERGSGANVTDEVNSTMFRTSGGFAAGAFVASIPFLLFFAFVRGMFHNPQARIKMMPNATPLSQSGAFVNLSQPSGGASTFTKQPTDSSENTFQRMQALQKLLDNGLITQQEFDRKRAEILADI